MSAPLKVLLAVWVNELGSLERGSTYEHAHFLPTLEAMGCSVTVFDLAVSALVGPAQATAQLTRLATSIDPDLIFCALVEDDLDPAGLRALTERWVTFNWFADDHWRFESFSSRWAPWFRWVSTTDRQALDRYAERGIDTALLTQWAASVEAFHPRGRALEHEVTFVGQRYGGREQIVADLRRQGVDLEVFGTGWGMRLHHRIAGRLPGVRRLGGAAWAERRRASTRLDQAGMVRLFETSRINLNLSDSSHGSRAQIKGRVFEVPACGGFLLTQAAEHLTDFLVPDQEVAVFEDPRELPVLIRSWLADEDHRAATAARGLARVQAEHTYRHRFQTLFSQMGLDLPRQI